VIAALILFGWPLIQGKFFPTANLLVTKIQGGKIAAVPNPTAYPATDGPTAFRNRNAVIAEIPRLHIEPPACRDRST